MNIGEVAARSGVPAKTIRYYEDIGLIRPARGANGYRDFSDEDAHRLAFVGRARALGFPVEDCRRLLALWSEGRPSREVRALAAGHLAEIERRLRELQAMRDALSDLVDRCAGDDRPTCPIIDRLGRPSA
ncbi:Cu(I)-responsive transcriptional regulator [Hasllibacter halocynthiae]|uniref:Cu(I)-responsive transcriptional regulator n=1 Tax=Hasllibacter halocynthiae TaxID=595589 RepID=A0A2T0X4A4_9RHOB|nr:Cu(I)-responsive transcriptional regulator [Hasllibacter halocynthiae]PRY93769.1 Cu(I)-responsive transcriptional regulator [Hasllibacter halocynthiae]